MARGDLTDEQWAVLEPLLPVRKKAGRPAVWTRRQLIDGIRFRVRTGVPWRDVPEQYGSWGRVYELFRRWQRDGTWQRVFTQLQARADAKDLIGWDLDVDASATVHRTRRRAEGRRCPAPARTTPPTPKPDVLVTFEAASGSTLTVR
ncbi:transposase [Actinacidiphila glaucinigra]|uniref:transposase n=1 Tax=Actinacidiphila glaucinigra TaxID=235986 RepID=UPI0035E2B270